ncbi:hypothetical protein HHK36_032912 [Tetracentron sinense]|uniref:Uncharacterized protein n=1 Tax=Tetracentron sinense TaxID=13715 RepID=A0A834Y7B9_TETSI|nr:hypothetical protein HHK36_032912 [Tetracentron sinense]
MRDEGNLKTWVSDKLDVAFGILSAYVVQYVIGLSKQASSPAEVLYQKQEKEAAMLVRKQKSYALLDADDDDEGVGGDQLYPIDSTSQSKKVEARRKHFRKKIENQDDEDDEV